MGYIITICIYLGVQQFDFQQSLRDHLMSSVHYPRSVEFFVNECDTFFSERNNFIKALHFTEVICMIEKICFLNRFYCNVFLFRIC